VLRIGDQGSDVKEWQTFLCSQNCLGADGRPLTPDGKYGANTVAATKAFQSRAGLPADGIAGPKTLTAASALGFRPAPFFVQAKNYTPASRGTKDVRLVVVHTMEAPKSVGRAKQVAQWFAGDAAPNASAHYCIDNREVWQCVREKDLAWHAPGVNTVSIGLEHAGYAAQSEAEWLDEYNEEMLRLSAALTARICKTYGIPPFWLTEKELGSGKLGVCGHYDVTMVLGNGKGHTDPGPNFPKQKYMALVRQAM